MERSKRIVIGLSGVSCSGKTTLATHLYMFFKNSKNNHYFGKNTIISSVDLISQDNYFFPADYSGHIVERQVNHVNWEVMGALNMEQMCQDITKLLEPKISSQIPCQVDLKFYNILILEGFLLFNHQFTSNICNIKLHLHICYETCRLRRCTRVYDPPDVPAYFEAFVWPYYEKHLKALPCFNDILFVNGDTSSSNIFNFSLKHFRSLFYDG